MAKIIVALDGMNVKQALDLAKKLSGQNVIFKVNDLLDDRGIDIVSMLREFGEVMDDPKFFDIPNTVGTRVRKHASHKPLFITVHGQNIRILQAAAANRGDSMILAVSVLTTIGEEECNLNLGGPVKAKVLQYARNAVLAQAQGLVSSAQELEFLSAFPETKSLIKVTPAIRPAWYKDPKDDQARPTTPEIAIRAGADYIVIGRPITKAADPLEALQRTIDEVNEAEANMENDR